MGVRLNGIVPTLLFTAVVLAATADERTYGLVTDGQVMTRTAFAISDLGEIGMARGHPVNVVRPSGDAVTRYGMGPSLVQVPVTALAPSFERAFGLGSSQTLFVLLQLCWVLLAAASAAGLARAWGGEARDASRALLAAALSSPLWGYLSSDFSEPLQAALVGWTFALAAFAALPGASRRRELAFSAGAGAVAGLGLLSKSILIVLLPAVALVLVASGRREGRFVRAAAAFLGSLPFVLAWLAFEFVRFGRPFASYGGEHFSHPFLDGLWRLTIGPNKGLLLYFPLALLAAVGIAALLRTRRAEALVPLGFVAFLLATTAAWWSWDGTAGWGPRLLVPATPILAASAALAARRFRPALFWGLFAAGAGVNLLGALQPDAVTTWYYSVLPRPPLSEAEAARYPRFAVDRDESGAPYLLQVHAVHSRAAFSPLRLSAWLLQVRLFSSSPLEALKSPPWDVRLDGWRGGGPPERAIPSSALVFLTSGFRWPHLGMSLVRGAGQLDTALAYVDCVFDQALRAQDMRDGARAVAYAERLWALAPGPQAAVTYAEALRMAGRPEQVYSLVQSLPENLKSTPDFGLTWALLARDRGEKDRAVRIVQKVARLDPRPEVRMLAALRPEEWPATLREVLRPPG